MRRIEDCVPFACLRAFRLEDITLARSANERALYEPEWDLSYPNDEWVDKGTYIDEGHCHTLVVNGWLQTWEKGASPLVSFGRNGALHGTKWYKRGREVYLIDEFPSRPLYLQSIASHDREHLERFLKDMREYLCDTIAPPIGENLWLSQNG